jgi:hypothetical protein
MPAKRKLVQGVGVNDAPFSVPTNDPIYRSWLRMLYRCYGPPTVQSASYVGCTVEPAWHSFMNFREWVLTQDWEGNQLDKDLLVPGNKVYGPLRCCFVPRYINMIGPRLHTPCVKREPRGKPWGARINANGKFVWLGSFNTEQEAIDAWKKARSEDVLRLLSRYQLESKKPDSRVVIALRAVAAGLV